MYASYTYEIGADRLGSVSLVSPTVFREIGFRFFFFSREEPRMHIHVISPDGEAKFWLEPTLELAQNWGLAHKDLTWVRKLIEARNNEIRAAWRQHFG
jgi:hypothetical protein